MNAPIFSPQHQRRSRLTMLLLAALFFGPVFAAAILYYIAPQYRPSGLTNYGTLVNPAKPVPAMSLADVDGKPQPELLLGKWSLIQLGAAECDAACAERFLQLRQVRLALGKNLGRLQRVYIAPDVAALAAMRAQHAAEHPDAHFVADGSAAGTRASDFFHPQEPNALYLVDPNGNWLMVYSGAIDSKLLLKDLKTLMRLSSIG